MPLITDPYFYLVAIPAVLLLGLSNSMLMALEKGTVDAVVFFGTAQDVAVAKKLGVTIRIDVVAKATAALMLEDARS